jgi:pilus assembly protein CpaE
MADVQRIIICDPNKNSREALQNVLVTLDNVVIESISTRYDGFVHIAEQNRPEVAIVVLDSDPQTSLGVVEHVARNCPDTSVVAVSAVNDARFIRDVYRRGAKETLSLPLDLHEVVDALHRLTAGQGPVDSRQRASKVVAFIGARGGVGCTSLAVNVGCILARQPNTKVCLVDLNLTMGDADVCLDLYPPVHSLLDVVINIERIDLQLLSGFLIRHKLTGLHLLARPANVSDSAHIRDEHIQRIVTLLKLNFNYVLLDLSKAFGPMEFAALELADDILLTIQLDVSCLNNVLRLMQVFKEPYNLADKVKVIANRVGADGTEITVPKAQEAIDRPILCEIPNEARTMMASRNAGVPLLEHAPRSKLFLAMQSLCDALAAEVAESGKTDRGGGWFGRK